MKKIIALMHRAIKEYNMIENGDKIAVGLSCGKDSLTLLKALATYKLHAKQKFEIFAITIDIFGNTDYKKIKNFCDALGVEFFVVRTNINEIVFDIRKEKNPCSLCAKLRRGNLNSKAVELGCNKVALGHHADDFIETFFLSLTNENRLSTFWPLSYLSNTNLFVIRPFLYVWEKLIINNSPGLPVIKNVCVANKKTKREETKILLEKLNQETPNFKYNLLESLTQTTRYNLLDKSKNLISKKPNHK